MHVKKILVPTDFSPSAERALSTASELAKVFKAQIVLLHACRMDIPVVFAAEGSFAVPSHYYEELMAGARAHVNKIATELAAKEGLVVEGIVVSEPVEIAILEHAKQLPADMIVMGTRGLTGLKHVVLGSSAERVVRLARCPVLTVNAGE